MNPRTKRVAIIAGVLAVVAAATTALSVRIIMLESAKLTEQIMAVELDGAQQTIFTRISRTETETQAVRDQLQSFFVEPRSGSIDFLNYIESQAVAAGIQLETISPEEVVRDDVTFISISYSMEGSLVRLENFIEQLENIPYVSSLQSLDLQQRSGSNWVADVIMEVQVSDYEN